MKRHLFILMLTVIAVKLSFAQHKQHLSQTKISEDLYYSVVTDSIFMITHYFPFWGGNSLFVLLPDNKGMLIDTPYENSGTESLLSWIATEFGEIELTAIITGFHQDNLGGNEVLREKGIDIYGPDLTRSLVINEGDSFKAFILKSVEKEENKRYYESYTKLKLTPPNKLFPINDGLQLTLGDEIFEVYFPGESHTIDNTVVYLHKRRILFGGCMIKGIMYKSPGLMDYANMEEWPGAVQKVMARFPECSYVVPGHGDYGGEELLSHTLKVLHEWQEKNKP